jgi:7-cyano-7-deazaguanine synthase
MNAPQKPRAVVLLSGGIDSTTALAIARSQGYALFALTIRYGQRHAREIDAARAVARAMDAAEHVILDIDLRRFGGSALTADIDVPKDRPADALREGIPPTYVPARNTIFLSFALAWAETLGAADIFIGANVLDASGYPDCRPAFLAAFESLARLATRAGVEGNGVRVRAPLIEMSKAEIVRAGTALGVDYALTWSCYDPVPEVSGRVLACGRCDTCQLRLKGFREAGVRDPIQYSDEANG